MAKFGRSWWRFSVHRPCISYHHLLVYVDACNTQNAISLLGFMNMSQDFTDIPLAHVCNCVCCFVYVKGHESDVCGVLRVICRRLMCCCIYH